jgi:NAD(P)H-dependent flavin oxidoreductase YrpB (nitropropane dioxygenase family)
MFKLGDFKLKTPIVQGGMAVGVSLDNLSSAVSNEGGIGVIGTAGMGLLYTNGKNNTNDSCIKGLTHYIKKAKEKTNGILGVNIMVALSNYAEMVKVAVEEKVDVIFSGAGLPLNLPSFLKKDSKTKIVPIVSSLKAAQVIFKKWFRDFNYIPDGFVVEGPDAGGHLGFKEENITNFDFEGEVKKIINFKKEIYDNYKKYVSIIVGGGIYNKETTQKYLSLDADAVQIGTSFIATDECDASKDFKNVIINTKQEDIKIIKSPVGMPGRAVNNNFIKRVYQGEKKPQACFYQCIKTCEYKNTLYCIAKALYDSVIGDIENGLVFCGKNAYKIKEIISVHNLIKQLV